MIPLLAQLPGEMWYALPLIISVSLVYGATRHELMVPILHNSLRIAVWVTGFMAAIFAVLFVICRML